MYLKLIFILLMNCFLSPAQKYSFVNWTVEDGLIQSQASFICQDQYRQLWIGTEGGVSCFDGKRFVSYTVKDGLVANRVKTMYNDQKGRLWLGTSHGVSVFNGRSFNNIPVNENFPGTVQQIAEMKNGSVYALVNLQLFRINGSYTEKISLSGDSAEIVTALYQCRNGDLLVYVYKKGIYRLDGNKTALHKKFANDERFTVLHFFITSGNDTLLSMNSGLFRLNAGALSEFGPRSKGRENIQVFCLGEDLRNNLWLGTDKGAYQLADGKWQHFNEKSGFTDNSVNHIFRDAENNLWFATNADGIFKFSENVFTYYDKSSGLTNPVIMGIAQANNASIHAAGYGGGLYVIGSDKTISSLPGQPPALKDALINCLYTDRDSSLWIGTQTRGIWHYTPSEGFRELSALLNKTGVPDGATTFLRDSLGRLFIGSNQGLFVLDQSKIKQVNVNEHFVTSLVSHSPGKILAGTSKGVYEIGNTLEVSLFGAEQLANTSVLCMALKNGQLWIGTSDKGVLSYQPELKKLVTYNTDTGLPSNFIYSLDVSDKGSAWIGTGFGICHLQLNNAGTVLSIKNYGRNDGLLGMECNHNSILRAGKNSLWFGTTKGLFHFNPSESGLEKNQPIILLRSVKLFSTPISDSGLFKSKHTWFDVPEELKLNSRQNHLTFELGSIFFTNPGDVIYRYMLAGADKAYSTGNNPDIIYPSLPPGIYTLRVSGITKSGIRSVNEITYTFEIKKAFYQTPLFQLLIILILLATGAMIAYVFTRGRQKRKQKEKELHARIREEEFLKLRQRTAEDFHDELGNSLTRITVLSDILKSKINENNPELNGLVKQIKENTAKLYSGSRDIIWSLNSRNDGLFEIAEHLKQIAHELFSDTTTELFFTHHIDPKNPLKLKLDYSRNLTMVFKEICSNILKHAAATEVTVNLVLKENNMLWLEVTDNGKGFDETVIKGGNGLRNIRNRIMRMNGEIKITAVLGKGTKTDILLKDIFSS